MLYLTTLYREQAKVALRYYGRTRTMAQVQKMAVFNGNAPSAAITSANPALTILSPALLSCALLLNPSLLWGKENASSDNPERQLTVRQNYLQNNFYDVAPATGGIGGTGSVDSSRFRVGLARTKATPAYSFSAEDFRSLRYTRTESFVPIGNDQQTQLHFSLRPGKFDFSLAGGFGLGAVFSQPQLEMRSSTPYWRELDERLPELHDGLSYSAGVKIEHEYAQISDTAYVSSSQLGLSYGRLGRVWYNGVDLSLQQTNIPLTEDGAETPADRVSLDVTTGRKVSWTGVGSHDPLWLLSLRGDFDVQDDAEAASGLSTSDGDWYLNPSLFWQTPDFRFSAQLEVPIDEDLLKDDEEPDYRLRAIIEKSFK